MANETTSSDDDFLDMDTCQICNGSECGVCCKDVASRIVNNASHFLSTDDTDYSDMSVVEKLKTIALKLGENTMHQQLRGHDISGVCQNVATNLSQTDETQQELDITDTQGDQYHHLSMVGLEGLIANLTIENDEEGLVNDTLDTMLENFREQFSFDENVFQNDEERAIYVINTARCVYNQSRRLEKDEVIRRMNIVVDLIRTNTELRMPDNIATKLFSVFNKGTEGENLDNAAAFAEQLGESFGRAYKIMTGQKLDEENDNINDDEVDGMAVENNVNGGEDNIVGADENNDIDDDDDYGDDESERCASSEEEEEEEEDDDDSDYDESEDMEVSRRVRRRHH